MDIHWISNTCSVISASGKTISADIFKANVQKIATTLERL